MSSSIRHITAAVLAVSLAIPATVAGGVARSDVGPGPVSVTMHRHGRLVRIDVRPNAAGRWNDVDVRVTRGGRPERSAAVSVRFEMPVMGMRTGRFRLRPTRPGAYRYSGPALSMPGLWRLTFTVTPARGGRFDVVLRDRVR